MIPFTVSPYSKPYRFCNILCFTADKMTPECCLYIPFCVACNLLSGLNMGSVYNVPRRSGNTGPPSSGPRSIEYSSQATDVLKWMFYI